jgi:hypothetical protein
MTDTEILNSLEQIVSSQPIWRDIILCWDHEDGYFVGSLERGDANPYSIHDDNVEEKRQTLRESLEAAIRHFQKKN